MNKKYIFVVGGVMSSVGKGVTAASIGLLMKSRGYHVTNVKCEMYVNIDAGTIRPTEHGEVFVGSDGIEADQDLGNYERFTDQNTTSNNFITQGQIWQDVIKRERNLEYNGEDVEVVPDIPREIIRRIDAAAQHANADITVIEFGGTIGEYQISMFLEAARMLKQQFPDDVAFVMVSYLPIPKMVGEMKTKPTQYAARTLNSAGIVADFIVARAETKLDEPRRQRLALFCNIATDGVISAQDVSNIYEVPLELEGQQLDSKLLKKLGLEERQSDLSTWRGRVTAIRSITKSVKIAMIGKYFGTGHFTLADSYISVIESIKHAAWAENVKTEFSWVDSENYEHDPSKLQELLAFDGVIAPGGFGSRGVEGIIQAIQYIREQKIPYFGICYGMQLALVEIARHCMGLRDAHTTEVNQNTSNPVIDLMPEQYEILKKANYGGTMRLGSYPAFLKQGTLSYDAYGTSPDGRWNFKKTDAGATVRERHRHRYEVNPTYIKLFEEHGIVFSGISLDGHLMEIMELRKDLHPFFLGTQFHPEFTGSFMSPHPIFCAFLSSAKKRLEINHETYPIKPVSEEVVLRD